MHDLLIYNQSS